MTNMNRDIDPDEKKIDRQVSPAEDYDTVYLQAVEALESIQSGILECMFLTLPQYSAALKAARPSVKAFVGSGREAQYNVLSSIEEAIFAYDAAELIWESTARKGETVIKAAMAAAMCALVDDYGGKYNDDVVQSLVAAAIHKGEDPSCMSVQTTINALWGLAGMRIGEISKEQHLG